MKLIIAILVAAAAMAAPAAAMADEQPRLVVTMVCTIYTDELAAGIDAMLGTNLGQYASDCTIDTEYLETEQATSMAATMATDVSIPQDSYFPACANTDSCFDPYNAEVQPGTSITWTNNDSVAHTVTGAENHPDGDFDGEMRTGERFTFTFNTPGTYEYGCIYHPWATGVVTVTEDARSLDILAQALVDDLIDQYIENGTGALDDINAALNPDAPVAGFVVDVNSFTIVAHTQNPGFLGFPVEPLLEQAFIPIDAMLRIIQEGDGVWLSYPVPDTSGNIIGYERGWFKIEGDYVFGGRYNIDDETRAQSIVQEMIRIYDLDAENALESINAFMSMDPQYPFVLDPDTTHIVAHGADSSRVGDVAVIFTNSTVSLEEFRALSEDDGVWADYVFYNPVTQQDENKRSWLVKHDGYIFGSGYYP